MKEFQEKFENWAQKFQNEDKEEMSLDLAKIFLIMGRLELTPDKEIPIPDFMEFSYKVAKTRAESIHLKINDPSLMLISFLSNGIPGNIVMYLYYLKHHQLQYQEPITIRAMATELFPMGFVTKEALARLWDAQKVKGSNMLDAISFE